jgi:uncharacterized protein YndB with AHSA1/START domain
MVRLEFTITINRPPSEVFAYLTDPQHLPEWQSSALEAKADRPMGVGTRIMDVRKFLGRRVESTVEVTEYEPDSKFSLKALSGPIPFQAHHTLRADDGGTRLTFVGEGEPGGFFKLAGPLVARQAERQFKGDFETLKDLLETRPDG